MRQMSILRSCVLLSFAALFLVAVSSVCPAAERPPEAGELFPALKLPTPKGLEDQAYLGLGSKPGPTFKLSQLKARVVILEVFSMYCPYCQAEAQNVNGLFQTIAERGLDGQVKIVGIGAGNSAFEVKLYRDKYAVRFPLLADQDLVLHGALGKVRTPYFIVVKLDPGGSQKVIHSKVGSIGSPELFLDMIVQSAGLP